MKVDEAATKHARRRHETGVRTLDELFGFTPATAPFVPQTGRAVGVSRADRLLWRTWRDSLLPRRVAARKRRKAARASRKRNRR